MPLYTAIIAAPPHSARVALEAASFEDAMKKLEFFCAGFSAAGGSWPKIEGLNLSQRPRGAVDLLEGGPIFGTARE